MPSYGVVGLTVDSEIVLPGLSPAKAAGADVLIRQRPVPLSLEGAEASRSTWARAGDRFHFRLPGLARFLLVGGRDISFETEGGTSSENIAALIAANVLGIALHQRGLVAIKAAAVDVAGRAVLLCGASGAGKSTLAAALVQKGYSLLSDDMCVIVPDAVPKLRSDGHTLKLWQHTIDKLEIGAKRGAQLREGIGKFCVEAERVSRRELPVGAIYALREARAPHKPGIETPNIVDAALTLRRNALHPRLINELNQRNAYFQAAALTANAAGIHTLLCNLEFGSLPSTIAMLEDHWAKTGLSERAA